MMSATATQFKLQYLLSNHCYYTRNALEPMYININYIQYTK